MRTLTFWFGLGCAALCGMIDPAWGYAAVFALSLVQLLMLAGSSGASVFLLIHYAVVLTYFSLAPAIQISQDVEFWGTGILGMAAHRQALMLLLLYLAGVEAARFSSADALPAQGPAGLHRAPPLGGINVMLLLGFACVAFAALFARPDFNFVPRGIVGDDDSRPFALIAFSTLPKILVLSCFVVLAIHALRARTAWAWAAAALALALAAIAGNPVNTARQILLIGLLPLFIHCFARRRRWMLAALIFAAVAGLGPVLNLMSRGSFYDVELQTFPYTQDFDPMFVVAGILERIPTPELGLGRYLLSAVSFFLPRDLKLFPDFDPLGWPAILGNFSQSNLSLPPFATAYFDFGLAGPVMLGFAISAGFRLVDRAIDPTRPISGAYLAALLVLASYVPFSRGPILGWGPFAASGLIAALVAGALARTQGGGVWRPTPVAVRQDRSAA
jgi:hypothetical protein